ncbi:MAG: family 43 glycosylhydrolase [Lachnospiraceae bacterium]|nr:family 43 glycosylhydrolase [Lachnospiraceae bacterium]
MITYENKQCKLLVYTRQTNEKSYPDGLARSIHFAVSRDGQHYQPLHQNYGILFAQAEIRSDNTICPKGVKDPVVFVMSDRGFGIVATRVNEDGSGDEDCRGQMLLWRTVDFMDFQDIGMVEEDSYIPDGERKECCVIQGETVTGSWIQIDAGLCDRLLLHWNPLSHVSTYLPDSVTVTSREELETLRATAVYSDGSTVSKKVAWQTEQVDFSTPGIYQVKGSLYDTHYSFPLARGYGDPVIFPWEGKWYFLGTNDNLNDIGIYVREADTVSGLFGEGVEEHLILGVDEEKGFVQTFWAPEFHIIGGQLYILFAVGGKKWGPQCYLMKLKTGGRIIEAESWEIPVKVLRQNGKPLAESGITLDMTYVSAGGRSYMVWSYREHIGTPADTGSMLYIAEVDATKPWQLSGEPVLLSRPLFGWENVNGTINNEGPHAFVYDGKVFLTYSGGDAAGYTYVLGLLTADATQNLTDVSVWKKSCTPVLSFYSVEGEYGPGHNSFFIDDDGNLMIAYHAEDALESRLRSDGIRRIHFDVQGTPRFDVSAARDLNPALRDVSIQVIVQ